MKDINLNDLDLQDIANWPVPAKGAVIIALCVGVLALGYFLDTKKQLEALDSRRAQEASLKQTFETKQAKAANLPAYRNQMAEMEESFGAMLRQLPSKTEVEALLVDISQTGLASGIEFRLFKPAGERKLDFYAEQPINMTLIGDYHEFAQFASGIAALPRIVTLHDISLSSATKGALTMNVVAKTYRYLDDDEMAAAAKNAKNAKKGRRK